MIIKILVIDWISKLNRLCFISSSSTLDEYDGLHNRFVSQIMPAVAVLWCGFITRLPHLCVLSVCSELCYPWSIFDTLLGTRINYVSALRLSDYLSITRKLFDKKFHTFKFLYCQPCCRY